ncbi:hypothetical protein Ahy_Scaffold6g108157 isoform B [Arachis hypogaea]|uniref:Uncharacterized protein n=1 Tax=Arachis hypogaea TaxID=3818 RepID=A0A444WPH4_ARAHY|nr:hypothetical protein Ahy_Scaffold6g108157 isoform B [Arachis hypogaea]
MNLRFFFYTLSVTIFRQMKRLQLNDQPVTSNCENSSLYVLEWLLPRIGFLDKIIVKDLAGLACKIFLKTIALGGHSTEVVRLQSNTDFSKFHG